MKDKNKLLNFIELSFIFFIPLLLICLHVNLNINNSGNITSELAEETVISFDINLDSLDNPIVDLIDIFNVNVFDESISGLGYSLLTYYFSYVFINFCLWHLIYRPLDYVVHLADRRRC